MSQENVERARVIIDALNRADWEVLLNEASPDFELDMSRANSPDTAGVHDAKQMRQAWERFAETWEAVSVEPSEFIAVEEHVVVPVTLRARGRGGIEVPSHPAWVLTFERETFVRACMYQERADALEAVGLSE
jgi:ketosteroid isomerase-like protein